MNHQMIWLDAFLVLMVGTGLPRPQARAGQALSEYGTILAVIVGVALVAMVLLGAAVNGIFGDMANAVNSSRSKIKAP